MSATAIKNLAERLETHQQTFHNRHHFPLHDGQRPYYMGRGGFLGSIGSTAVSAFARGWKSTTVEVQFTAPHPSGTPNLHTEIGLLRLFAEGGGVQLEAQNTEKARKQGGFPDITELVAPLGGWIAAGVTDHLHTYERNLKLYDEQNERFDKLKQLIMHEAGELDEATLLQQSTVRLQQIIAASKTFNQGPQILTPSTEDVAALTGFVTNPNNVTAGYSMAISPSGGLALHLTEVPGPLLG